ncbi:MAG: 2-isopropylmalate synthase [Clostridiaceae bacterium]|nr:2-isopropylmalate synthase [Clostridiaceae bacterium]
MKTIRILDTTLRDGEQSPGCSMDIKEKIEVARSLEKLGVDIIEAGFPAASPGDLSAVQTISGIVQDAAVCALSRALKSDIDSAWAGVRAAASPILHVFIATSPIHMAYKLRMSPAEVLETAASAVAYAKSFCADVEFSAEDATRSDRAFLARIVEAVVRAGATVVNLPDTVGYATPLEITKLFTYIRSTAHGAENCVLSTHNHNDLGMATANTLAAVAAGAGQVECTINGIGERAGNAALEETIMALRTRSDIFQCETGVNTKRIYRSSRLIQTITGIPMPPNKAIVGTNAFAHEAGIHQHGVMANPLTYEIIRPEELGIPQSQNILGKHSGRHAFDERLCELGYHLTREELDDAFEKFKALADKKKVILDYDLEALVGAHTEDRVSKYNLVNFVINSGNTISSTAIVKLSDGEREIERVALGDGPVDAAFKAINDIVGMDLTLESYRLSSVTGGEDALGEAVVHIRSAKRSVVGRGLSTDVIEASINAYVNGVNKLAGEPVTNGEATS